MKFFKMLRSSRFEELKRDLPAIKVKAYRKLAYVLDFNESRKTKVKKRLSQAKTRLVVIIFDL